ncbi:hypothetical protein [Haladaptatus sp. DFWS20]|uniref:hypothetical protein n=1 Tax=Haladaptatus sp. DFWS20 TaxID=3403467 RepID=UPI003EB7F923
MTVVVGDTALDMDGGSQSDGFWFDGSKHKVWHHSGGDVTLAQALSTVGVEATAETLTYDGTTYEESTDGTGLYYRVNGEPVNPTEYTLKDGDEVWATVETAEMNRDTPGDHIDHDYSHIHGNIDFVVNGHEIDFSKSKYQTASHSRYFHFEGGHADPWHAHSYSITLEYAMSTLDGISVSENSVTYEDQTYTDDDGVSVTVNGNEVAPSGYYLKDGDHVEIVVESDE